MNSNNQRQKEIIKDVFNTFAPEYVELFMDIKPYEKGVREFTQLLGGSPSVLDLGCGPGNVATAIFKLNNNANIIGVDISPSMIKFAKQELPSCEFHIADVTEPSVFGDDFDGVVMAFILPYIDPFEAKEILKKVYSVLKQRGYLLVMTMIADETNTVERISKTMEKRTIRMTYYSALDIKELIIDSGFSILIEDYHLNEFNGETEILLIAKKD